METKPLLIAGGLGALYYAYTQGWLSSLGLAPTTAAQTTLPYTTTTANVPVTVPIVPITNPAIPVSPGAPPAAAPSTLAANLIATAGVTAGTPLNVDQWNYYLKKLQPNATVTDLSSVGVMRGTPGFTMTADQYAALRTQANLSGLGHYSPSNRFPSRALLAARYGHR